MDAMMAYSCDDCRDKTLAEMIDHMAESDDEAIRNFAAQLENKHFGVEPHLQEMSA